MIQCPVCNKEFASERAYSGHKSIHNEGGRYSKSRIKIPREDCLNCGVKTKKAHQKYCSISCQQEWLYKTEIKSRIESKTLLPRNATFRYLVENNGRRCNICMNEEWNSKPIPLDIEHIDGDPTNNLIDNLRLICPNCHRQTETWGMKKHRRELRMTGQMGRRCLDTAKKDGSIPSSSTIQ